MGLNLNTDAGTHENQLILTSKTVAQLLDRIFGGLGLPPLLVSTSIDRDQNLVPPQKPRRKGRIVTGPYGIAHHGKAPVMNP